MSSTRLPGKILEPINGRPLLDHILSRLVNVTQPVTIVVATSDMPADDVVESFCGKRRVPCFRGSEADVLARYYKCARHHGFSQIVRLTGDNPFTDVDELNRLIDFHVAGGFDYSSSLEELPLGVGAEIFTFAALEDSFRHGLASHHREHVDEYILENRNMFRTGRLTVPFKKQRPEVRLTVDTQEDLRRVRFVSEQATSQSVSTEEAIELCSRFA